MHSVLCGTVWTGPNKIKGLLLSFLDHARIFLIVSWIAFIHNLVCHVQTIVSSLSLVSVKFLCTIFESFEIEIKIPGMPIKQSDFALLQLELLFHIDMRVEACHEISKHLIAGHFKKVHNRRWGSGLVDCEICQIIFDIGSSDHVLLSYILCESLKKTRPINVIEGGLTFSIPDKMDFFFFSLSHPGGWYLYFNEEPMCVPTLAKEIAYLGILFEICNSGSDLSRFNSTSVSDYLEGLNWGLFFVELSLDADLLLFWEAFSIEEKIQSLCCMIKVLVVSHYLIILC